MRLFRRENVASKGIPFQIYRHYLASSSTAVSHQNRLLECSGVEKLLNIQIPVQSSAKGMSVTCFSFRDSFGIWILLVVLVLIVLVWVGVFFCFGGMGLMLLFSPILKVTFMQLLKIALSNGNLITERLDRGFCCMRWRALFQEAIVTHLDHEGSDHKPLLISNIFKPYGIGDRPRRWVSRFHFKEAWVNEDGCRDLIEKAWRSYESSKAISGLLGNVGVFASSWAAWNMVKKKDSGRNLKAWREELSSLYAVGNFVVLGAAGSNRVAEDERYWRQRSRALWLKSGDKNTIFFHARASQRRKRNRILGLFDGGGVWHENEEEIEGVISDYYENLFYSSRPFFSDLGRVLSAVQRKVLVEMNQSLVAKFTLEAIRLALKQMAHLKAPGSDGLLRSSVSRFGTWLGPKLAELS
ncbi:hypothetical protein ACOSQ3_002058 [Xanthoceras sorbifolium]